MKHLKERHAFRRHLKQGPRPYSPIFRLTPTVAISNQRILAFGETGVTFRFKDYRRNGPERHCIMTLALYEFIRRFMLHVLPRGFHRIRRYSLFAGSARRANLALARTFLQIARPPERSQADDLEDLRQSCPCRGVFEVVERWQRVRAPPIRTFRVPHGQPCRRFLWGLSGCECIRQNANMMPTIWRDVQAFISAVIDRPPTTFA